MPTEVTPATASTASSKPVDDGHPRPPSSTARQSAPSDRRSSAGALVSTTALFLWSAYLVLLIALPEEGGKKGKSRKAQLDGMSQ